MGIVDLQAARIGLAALRRGARRIREDATRGAGMCRSTERRDHERAWGGDLGFGYARGRRTSAREPANLPLAKIPKRRGRFGTCRSEPASPIEDRYLEPDIGPGDARPAR